MLNNAKKRRNDKNRRRNNEIRCAGGNITHNNAPLVSAPRGIAVVQQGSEHGSLEALGRAKIAADDKGLDGAAAAASGLGDRHAPEQQPKLAVEQAGVPAAKNLGHEGTSWRQHVRRDVESC